MNLKSIFIILFPFTVLAQQQQNMVLASNHIDSRQSNSVVQQVQTNALSNAFRVQHDDHNEFIEIQPQIIRFNPLFSQKSLEITQEFGARTVRKNTVNHASSSRSSNKHVFTRKWKKFERNFFGRISNHKKSRHLVDICFNWN